MRTTRLAAAGAAAAIALGGTVAAASTTGAQTVTITVTAAARSITVEAPAGTLSVAVGATPNASTTSTLAYNAGATAGGAKITTQVTAVTPDAAADPSLTNNWTAALDDLTLSVVASGMSSDAGTAATAISFSDGNVAAADLVTSINENEVVTGKTITYTLGGTAPSTPVNASVQVTFTITDN